MNKNGERTFDLSCLRDRWPSEIVVREQVDVFSGGGISPRYLANLDSAGEGPPRFKLGRKVCYFTRDLVAWMQERVTIPERKVPKSDEEVI